MEEISFDLGREATAVQDSPSEMDGAASLLYELTGALEEKSPPSTPPPPPAPEPVAVHEEVTVASPPRIEPPVMIWKPERRFRLRRR